MELNATEQKSFIFLDRLLAPFGDCLTPEVAEKLVHLRADPEVQARVDELADKCTEGALTDEERAEYESYVHTIDVLAVLQAKARRLLRSRSVK
jgi:hypothetical protein